MKQNLLKTMFATAALAVGTIGASAQITALPVTEDFEDGTTGIFEGGSAYSNDNVGNVLRVVNSTATASFSPAYELKANEKVTFQFTAFHGWVSGNNNAVISINNSDGESLLSYTYGYNAYNVTDVSIGGVTVPQFSAFFGQSNCTVSGKSANGYTHTQYFVKNDGYNPIVTMTVTGVGLVEFNLSYTATSGAIDASYSGMLPAGTKIDLGSMTITTAETNEDRVIGIDDLSITSETSDLSYVSYTIKKVCGETELSSETLSAIEGTTVTLPTASYYDEEGKKYIYVSDDAETVGTAAEGNVYTVTYREAKEYTYAVYAVNSDNEELKMVKSGFNYEDEVFDVAYPSYININGTLWKGTSLNQGYYTTLTLSEDETALKIVYTESDITGVVYLSEAEDIDGLTLTSNSNTKIRSSNGASAYAKDGDVTFYNLSNGKYKLGAVICDAKSGNSTWTFRAGGKSVLEYTVTSVNYSEGVSEEFELNAASTPIILAQGGDSQLGVDLIYIVKTGDADVTIETAANIAAFKALQPGTEARLTLKDAKITYMAGTEQAVNLYMEDESGAIMFDNMMSGVMVQMGYLPGKAATGYITAVLSAAEGTPQLTIGQNVTDYVIGAPAEVEIVPTEIALADVAAEANVSKLVIVKNVALSSVDGKLYAKSGETEIEVSEKFITVVEDGYVPAQLSSLTAIVAKSGDTYQLCATAYVEDTNGIAGVSSVTANGAADVYTVSGVKVRKAGESLDGLAKGLYVVGGKKVVVK